MEQNKCKSSACCLLGSFSTNTSMDFGVLLLRLGVGAMMLVHGIPKLGMLISGNWAAFQDPLGIGNFLSLLLCVGAEFGCSILIFLGLFTRLASLLLIINMCVALPRPGPLRLGRTGARRHLSADLPDPLLHGTGQILAGCLVALARLQDRSGIKRLPPARPMAKILLFSLAAAGAFL